MTGEPALSSRGPSLALPAPVRIASTSGKYAGRRLAVGLRQVSSQPGLLCPKPHSAFPTSLWLRSPHGTRTSKCATRNGALRPDPLAYPATLPCDHANRRRLLFPLAEPHGPEQPGLSPQNKQWLEGVSAPPGHPTPECNLASC